MPRLLIVCTPWQDGRISPKAVCQAMATLPGFQVTDEDSFAAELERKRKIVEKLRENNADYDIDDLITKSVREKAAFHGPGVHVVISLGDGLELKGEIWATSIRLRGECSATTSGVAETVLMLRSLDIGEVDVVED